MNLKALKVVLIAFLWSISLITIAEDCKVNDSELQGNYEGGCKNGKADGYGIAKGKDSYEGDFALGRPHGKGTYTWADGERYDGEFLNGRISGKGSYKYKNGDRYDGEFSDGLRSGKGTHSYADGRTFSGEWRNNKPHKEVAQSNNNNDSELQKLREEINRLRDKPEPAQPSESSNQTKRCAENCDAGFANCNFGCAQVKDNDVGFLKESSRFECKRNCESEKGSCYNRC
jgi:hypothetical protein